MCQLCLSVGLSNWRLRAIFCEKANNRRRSMRAEPKNKRVPIMMTESMKAQIDAWRRPLGIDDRSEAIRLIIEEKLQAEGLAQAS
jgi:hypothetical protein